MNIDSSNLKATVNNVEYTWNGGFGSVLTSREYGLKDGELRVLGSELMFVWRIDTRLFRKPIIHWCFQDMSIDFYEKLKVYFFHLR